MGFRTLDGSTTADGGNRIMASVQPDAWHYGKWRARIVQRGIERDCGQQTESQGTGVADGARRTAGSATTIAARSHGGITG
jgi:hypothetical protein